MQVLIPAPRHQVLLFPVDTQGEIFEPAFLDTLGERAIKREKSIARKKTKKNREKGEKTAEEEIFELAPKN